MPTLSDEARRLRLKHTDFWLHYYLRLHRRAEQHVMKRAALVRLRQFQQQARQLLIR